jgi:hypothetical protein
MLQAVPAHAKIVTDEAFGMGAVLSSFHQVPCNTRMGQGSIAIAKSGSESSSDPAIAF